MDVGGDDVVDVATSFFCDRFAKIAAVAAEPAAAESPAMMAKVVFDILQRVFWKRAEKKAEKSKESRRRTYKINKTSQRFPYSSQRFVSVDAPGGEVKAAAVSQSIVLKGERSR